MNKRIILAAISICILFSGLEISAQSKKRLFVDVQEEKIIVRWAPENWGSVSGFNVYRQRGKNSWRKLNKRVIQRVKSVDKIIDILGLEQAGLYLSFFGLKGEIEELDDQAFNELMESKNGWQWVGAFSFFYPKIAQVLGLVYEDKEIRKGTTYNYKITKISNDGSEVELFVTKEAAVAGEIVAVPAPVDFNGESGDSEASFKWKYDADFNNQNYIVSYNLFRSDSQEGEFVKVNKAPIFILSSKTAEGELTLPEYLYVDKGLTNGNDYWYKLKAVNAVGRESSFSSAALIKPKDLTAPASPFNLSFKEEGEGVVITWDENREDDLAGYNIYRSLDPENNYQKVNPEVLAENQFIEREVQNNIIYWYRASAVDSSGNESLPSPALSVLVADKIPPGTPQKLSAEAEEGKIVLRWQANSESDLAGYRAYRATQENSEYLLLTQETVAENNYSDLLPETSQTTYWYKIKAVDTNFNESDFSQAVKARLPDKVAPRAPALFKTFSREEENLIQWLPNPESDLAGYNIYRKVDPEVQPTKLNEIPTGKDKKEFSDRKLVHQKKFYYFLTAVDQSDNESAPSKEVIIEGVDQTPPQAPRGLAIEAKEDRIILSWKKSKELDLKHYSVYRKEDTDFIKIATLDKEVYNDTEVEGKKKYAYYLRASDLSDNESQPSLEVEITFEIIEKNEEENED